MIEFVLYGTLPKDIACCIPGLDYNDRINKTKELWNLYWEIHRCVDSSWDWLGFIASEEEQMVWEAVGLGN